jgi:hypothetical protein
VRCPNLFRNHETLAKTASLLGVTGKLQSDSGTTHLVAEELWLPELEGEPHETRSRDFH